MRCVYTKLAMPECSCKTCTAEQIVTQVFRQKKQRKEEENGR